MTHDLSEHRTSLRLRTGAAAVLTLATAASVAALVVQQRSAAGAPEVAAGQRAVTLRGATGDLAFSTYLGGLEWDESTGAATDASGNSYVAGFTESDDYPRVGTGTRGHAASADAFVTKVAPDKGRLVWSTHLGGVDLDMANALTLDKAGNVYVVGRTGSPDFPTAHALRGALTGRGCTGVPCHDAFVTKLSPTGRVVWSTYFGGSGSEEATGVSVDSSGVYVTGITDSPDLPVKTALQGTFQSSCEGDLPCPYDGFVTKLTPDGDSLVYSTYLGGKATDSPRGITVDTSGSAYVVGSTSSTDFPLAKAFLSTLGGKACGPPPGEPCRSAFLTKLTPSGGSASYSTFLGGRGHDDGYSVAVDGENRPYVTGSTQSSDFPTRAPLQPRLNNRACFSEQPLELCDDGFLTAFDAGGQALRYSTYLGGRAEDQGLNVDASPTGEVLVAGRTDSTDFRVTRNAAQRRFGGYIDGFAMRLRPAGTILWSSFLGGRDADRATGISFGLAGSAHVTGRTLSPDFATVNPTQPRLKDDDYDAFLSVLK